MLSGWNFFRTQFIGNVVAGTAWPSDSNFIETSGCPWQPAQGKRMRFWLGSWTTLQEAEPWQRHLGCVSKFLPACCFTNTKRIEQHSEDKHFCLPASCYVSVCFFALGTLIREGRLSLVALVDLAEKSPFGFGSFSSWTECIDLGTTSHVCPILASEGSE